MNMQAVGEFVRRYHLRKVLFGGVGAVCIALALALPAAYAMPYDWKIPQAVRKAVPFPAVVVGSENAAPLNRIAEDLASVKRFYESQDFSQVGLRVDFSTPEGMKRLKVREREIVNKLVEDAVIRQLANDRGIAVTDDAAALAVAERLREVGSEGQQDVRERLARSYGWDFDDFASKVVLPSLYEEELRKWYAEDRSRFAEASGRAEEAAGMLRDGRTFEDVAESYSHGYTAKDGGSLGWFAYADLVEPLREPAKELAVGTPSAVIESDLGFHIIRIDERKTGVQGELVRVSQIFVPKMTFEEWFASEMRNMNVRVLVREYEFDRETSRIEFSDPAMREFEKTLFSTDQGDAAFLL